jgi:hypothetical protein
MKVEKTKNKILLYSWLPIGTYHKNVAIWSFFPSKSGEFRFFFFPMKDPSYRLKSYFQVEIWRNLALTKKKNKTLP